MKKLMSFVGLLMLFLSFILMQVLYGPILILSYIFYASGLFLLFGGMNKNANSLVVMLMRKRYKIFFAVFAAGMLLGLVYEFFGSYILGLWHYPYFLIHREFFIFVPFFWGFFMIIVHESYNFFDSLAKKNIGMRHNLIAVLFTSSTLFLFLEGINLLTKSWTYVEPANNVLVLFIGWTPLIISFVLISKLILSEMPKKFY